MSRKSFWGLAATLLIIGTSVARPPADPDPRWHAWFESLIDQDTMLPCCSDAGRALLAIFARAPDQIGLAQASPL